jgi:hypothetical protein
VATGLSQMNRALNLIPKRAEQRQSDRLRETFLDSGVAVALEAIDHQVLYGRRGTGKTHALRYIESQIRARGDVAVYVDLRTIGSPEGLFMGERVQPTERAARLLSDLLSLVHESLVGAALDDEKLIADKRFVEHLDALSEAISTVRVDGSVEVAQEDEAKAAEGRTRKLGGALGKAPALTAGLDGSRTAEARANRREVRTGAERLALNFTDIARALRDLADSMQTRRVWVLLDEWSSVPPDVQPLLGEFLVRCVTPIPKFTVKIGAIEQQSQFRAQLDGRIVGIELGADFTANINLDEFMVYEEDADRSIEFFRGLLFKHLTSGVDPEDRVDGLTNESDLVRLGFTEKRAFEELVRAAEGVPRDAINIASRAALRAGGDRIAIKDVRLAARAWFQADKEAALRGHPDASRLLNWIIDKVIREKKARGFLVNQKSATSSLLLALFDARVLHLVRRGYSAQDEPGERYDVWVIDFGAYVDLIHTKSEPTQLLAWDDVPAPDAGAIEVPTQDLRAIRRAVLDLDAFEGQAASA